MFFSFSDSMRAGTVPFLLILLSQVPSIVPCTNRINKYLLLNENIKKKNECLYFGFKNWTILEWETVLQVGENNINSIWVERSQHIFGSWGRENSSESKELRGWEMREDRNINLRPKDRGPQCPTLDFCPGFCRHWSPQRNETRERAQSGELGGLRGAAGPWSTSGAGALRGWESTGRGDPVFQGWDPLFWSEM